jgi:hypothetical protein
MMEDPPETKLRQWCRRRSGRARREEMEGLLREANEGGGRKARRAAEKVLGSQREARIQAHGSRTVALLPPPLYSFSFSKFLFLVPFG